ncbi:hypothetical protein Rs2_16107 [Raphanus sativus]|nr:hypothetical protein Rs2_16107 [Raphanus sativus]
MPLRRSNSSSSSKPPSPYYVKTPRHSLPSFSEEFLLPYPGQHRNPWQSADKQRVAPSSRFLSTLGLTFELLLQRIKVPLKCDLLCFTSRQIHLQVFDLLHSLLLACLHALNFDRNC